MHGNMRSLRTSVCFVFVLFFISASIPKTYSDTLPLTPLNTKIIIVGAGSSGIAAAVKLVDYGFIDITILEAEPRVGGRIHTIPFGDNVVDLGAQWLHGEKNNVVYELVKERDLLGSTMEAYKNLTFIRSGGELVCREIINPIWSIIDEIFENRENSSIPRNVSAYDYANDELQKALNRPEYKHIDKKIAAELLRYREFEECIAQSADEVCDGDQALTWKDKGFMALLDLLMKSAERGREYGILKHRLRLSKKVSSIHWKRNDTRELITCEDGKEILADHVIVTVSLGVLKENHATLFEPALPVEKQTAIKEISFGTFDKVFLEFDKQFWPDYWTGFGVLYTEEDLRNLKQWGMEGLAEMTGYYTVDYQPRVLEIFLNGTTLGNQQLTERDAAIGFAGILDFFVEYDVSEIVNVTWSSWYANSNFRGAYSYHSIKTLESGVSTRDLEVPLTVSLADCLEAESHCEKPIVQFAGEATSFNHYGTVHGAIETGWREADRLIEFYGINKEK